MPVDFDKRVEQAKTIFIGTVKVNEMGVAVFEVEKGIRNVKDGEEFSVEMNNTGCGIQFKPGQVWLYLGEYENDGSLLLDDEFGRVIEPNAAHIKEKFSYEAGTAKSIVE